MPAQTSFVGNAGGVDHASGPRLRRTEHRWQGSERRRRLPQPALLLPLPPLPLRLLGRQRLALAQSVHTVPGKLCVGPCIVDLAANSFFGQPG